MIEIEIFYLFYCVTHRPQWENVNFAYVGPFSASDFEPESLKNGYIGLKDPRNNLRLFFLLFFELSQGFKNAR